MANEKTGGFLNFITGNAVPVAMVVTVFFLFIPIPKILVDLCMVLNLALAIVILLVVVKLTRPSDFEAFPRVVLFQTMFSLAINISSTRLILAGKIQHGVLMGQSDMVTAFAKIVAGNNIVVGFVMFVILIVVQVLVVTKGAGRVSEVAARFTLDSMSSKFFDVDSRQNSGAITEEEALELKAAIMRDIDFYSNMDGSSKFVSGNVKAGIAITFINLLGGILMGTAFARMAGNSPMGIMDALSTYSKLTIGDGLTSQFPSLIISVATGLLITGTKSDDTLDKQLKDEFTGDGHIYEIVSVVLIAAGFIFAAAGQPSLLTVIIPIGILFFYIGYKMTQDKKKEMQAQMEAAAKAAGKSQTGGSPDDVNNIAPLDPLSLELGYALIPLVSEEHGAKLLERVTRIRREVALDMGLVVPSIRIIDNMTLDPSEYSFKIRGIEAGRSKLKLGYYMGINTGDVREEMKGEATFDPSFGMPAIWIPEDKRTEAEQAGYAVVDPPTVIATHLTEIIRSHAAEILGRQEVKMIVDKTAETNKIVVDEVLETAKFSYGQIEKVLQNLLREQVSIRNIVLILETLANYGSQVPSWILTEKVREALGKQICLQYADENHRLHVFNLSQEWAEKLMQYRETPADGSNPIVAFEPVDGRRWIKAVSDSFAAMQNRGIQPVVICPSEVRLLVRSSTEREMPGLIAISINEIMVAGNSIELDVLGEIKMDAGI